MLIRRPTEFSDFEVRAFLWSELRALDIDVRGGVLDDRRRVVFDLVVFEGVTVKRVIETRSFVGKYPKGFVVDAVPDMDSARVYLRLAMYDPTMEFEWAGRAWMHEVEGRVNGAVARRWAARAGL